MSTPRDVEDPADSPPVRRTMYTNDVIRLLSSFVTSLFTIAEPARVRAALESMLQNWDDRVAQWERVNDVLVATLNERKLELEKHKGPLPKGGGN